MSIKKETIIYVKLLGEELDVWRPVKAKYLENNIYEIIEQEYDRELETWEFEPKSKVICKTRNNNQITAYSIY